ncbi:MAG TPA: hypothetical protein VGT81_18295, partial [Casimicrobiaceae bacterium]|nr:hypothetical protein [Casimicrobiaceae bacterium]
MLRSPESSFRPIVDNAKVRSRMDIDFSFPHARRRRGAALFLALAAAVAVAASPAHAQNYPNRPIRVIVPFSAGGAVDGPMRIIAQ